MDEIVNKLSLALWSSSGVAALVFFPLFLLPFASTENRLNESVFSTGRKRTLRREVLRVLSISSFGPAGYFSLSQISRAITS